MVLNGAHAKECRFQGSVIALRYVPLLIDTFSILVYYKHIARLRELPLYNSYQFLLGCFVC